MFLSPADSGDPLVSECMLEETLGFARISSPFCFFAFLVGFLCFPLTRQKYISNFSRVPFFPAKLEGRPTGGPGSARVSRQFTPARPWGSARRGSRVRACQNGSSCMSLFFVF